MEAWKRIANVFWNVLGGILLVLMAIGIPLAIWLLLSLYVSQIQDFRHMQRWLPTDAVPIAVDLPAHVSRGRSSSRLVVAIAATYSYMVNGQPYIGHRVGIPTSYESLSNIEGWQHQEFIRLQGIIARGATTTVWVDPQNAQHAVLNRDADWAELALFGAVIWLFTNLYFALIQAIIEVMTTRLPLHVIRNAFGVISATCFTIPLALWGVELGSGWAVLLVSLAVVVQGALMWLFIRFLRSSPADAPADAKPLRTSRR